MASARHHDSGRQFVPVPTSHGDVWLDLLGYINKAYSRPYRLVRLRLISRMQAVPDMDRTEKFTEILKKYENEAREHIPDQEVRLVPWPIVREALPKQFRRPPWISDEPPTPSSRDGSAHTDEGRQDLEAVMSDEHKFIPPAGLQGMLAAYRATEVPADLVVAELRALNDPAADGLIAAYNALPTGAMILRTKVAGDLHALMMGLIEVGYLQHSMASVNASLPGLAKLLARYRATRVMVSTVLTELRALKEDAVADLIATLEECPDGTIMQRSEVAEMLLDHMMNLAARHAEEMAHT